MQGKNPLDVLTAVFPFVYVINLGLTFWLFAATRTCAEVFMHDTRVDKQAAEEDRAHLRGYDSKSFAFIMSATITLVATAVLFIWIGEHDKQLLSRFVAPHLP